MYISCVYLRFYIPSIETNNQVMTKADVNLAGPGNVYCEIIWGSWRQITSVSGSETGGVTETETIILDNALPDDPHANGTLIVQVWDHDGTAGDDSGAARYELLTNKEGKKGEGEKAGNITLYQIQFIQQKLQPYRWCKGQFCTSYNSH